MRFLPCPFAFVILSCVLIPSASASSLPMITANQNRTPAGSFHNGVLSIRLEIAKGEWHPEADDGMVARYTHLCTTL
jgi:hypothetical protein